MPHRGAKLTRGTGLLCGALLGLYAACARRPPEIHPDPSHPVASSVTESSAEPAAARRADPSTLASADASASASATAEPPSTPERTTSKSKRLTAFIRNDTEIWLSGDGPDRMLVPGTDLVVENKTANLPPLDNSGLRGLLFSPDEKRLYFTKSGWATSWAVFYVDLATGKLYFFHDANGYQLIFNCQDKSQIGRMITYEHSYFDINPGSASNLYFLVDSAAPRPGEQRTGGSGRRGVIGYEDENVTRFLARTCGLGQAPPSPPPTVIPPKLRASAIKCKDFSMKRDDLHFLDGTTLIRFRTAPKADEIVMILGVEDAEQLCWPR